MWSLQTVISCTESTILIDRCSLSTYYIIITEIHKKRITNWGTCVFVGGKPNDSCMDAWKNSLSGHELGEGGREMTP